MLRRAVGRRYMKLFKRLNDPNTTLTQLADACFNLNMKAAVSFLPASKEVHQPNGVNPDGMVIIVRKEHGVTVDGEPLLGAFLVTKVGRKYYIRCSEEMVLVLPHPYLKRGKSPARNGALYASVAFASPSVIPTFPLT
jgi:hypothetical protein